MVAKNTLRTRDVKQVFFDEKKNTVVDLNERLNQIELQKSLYACTPSSALPSTLSTMDFSSKKNKSRPSMGAKSHIVFFRNIEVYMQHFHRLLHQAWICIRYSRKKIAIRIFKIYIYIYVNYLKGYFVLLRIFLAFFSFYDV